jgi:hypothetical protein
MGSNPPLGSLIVHPGLSFPGLSGGIFGLNLGIQTLGYANRLRPKEEAPMTIRVEQNLSASQTFG